MATRDAAPPQGKPEPAQWRTLRDYFAATAMIGLADAHSDPGKLAKAAYAAADAMLAERSRPS